MKVHLVDGTFELFRAFYGSPSRSDADGQEVGATRGLLSSMAALVASDEVTHVAIAFDHVIESFRNELFSGYKTGNGIDPALFSQFNLAEEACAAFGLAIWPMIDFEADDALASGAARYGSLPEVSQVVLCSPDKDLTQCVKDPGVVTLDRMRSKSYDESAVREKFGIQPQSIPDYLALVGDTADGIPGIPRWGAKSTAQVLAKYGRLEEIPKRSEQWSIKVRGAAKLSENLQDNFEDALLYRTLATLRTDVPLQEELADLRYQGPEPSAAEAIARRLGNENLLRRLLGD